MTKKRKRIENEDNDDDDDNKKRKMAGKVKEKMKRGTKGIKISTPALQKVATKRMSITTMTTAVMADGGSTDGSSIVETIVILQKCKIENEREGQTIHQQNSSCLLPSTESLLSNNMNETTTNPNSDTLTLCSNQWDPFKEWND